MKLIGIDLGGTAIKMGLVDGDGNIMDQCSVPTPVKEGVDGIVEAIVHGIHQLIGKYGLSLQEIHGVGVGIPGACDETGFVYTAVNIFWENVPFGEKLRQRLGLEVYMENDATIAAMGEAVKGAMVGAKNAIFLTLGTGVGGGIMINHQVYSGSHGTGSEIGHMIIGENPDYDCNCGNNGCFETFASATALIKYTQKLLKEKDSLIIREVEGDLDKVNAKVIFDCAKEGDAVAKEAVDRFVRYLAIGIGNMITILDPEIIVIGGGVSKAGSYFIDRLNQEIPKYTWNKKNMLDKLAIAQLENEAGIIGSAMFAKSKLNKGFVRHSTISAGD